MSLYLILVLRNTVGYLRFCLKTGGETSDCKYRTDHSTTTISVLFGTPCLHIFNARLVDFTKRLNFCLNFSIDLDVFGCQKK